MLDESLWKEAFLRAGLNPSFYAHRERKQDEAFPWEHLDTGVTRSYLSLNGSGQRRGLSPGIAGPAIVSGVVYVLGWE